MKLYAIACLGLAVAAEATSELGRYATIIEARVATNESYDFVVAGGGIAGLTVADRLTENPKGRHPCGIANDATSQILSQSESLSSSMALLISTKTVLWYLGLIFLYHTSGYP